MASEQNQFEASFPEAYDNFEVERLFTDLAKAIKKNNLMPNAQVALLGKLCGYNPAKTAKRFNGYSADTLRQGLSQEVYRAFDELLETEEKIDWVTADLSKLLIKYKKSLQRSLFIDIPWQQVCREVLEQQRKQWLTSYPLGSGDRQMPEMYVPLELVEREPEDLPRISSELEPEKWSVREQEKRTPISNQEFFEQVLQGNSPKSNGRRIAIIGEPGAGKTTLLQKIGSEVKELPIWIDLADLEPNKHESLQDYLTEIWLTKWALSIIRKLCPEATLSPRIATDELKNALANEFEKGNVWLLLDGVDEMALTFRQPLTWVDRQLRGGWVADAKVVLTCRLNIWSESGNYLPDFAVYRNVDFTDEQVEEFIEKWFAKEPDSCEKLKAEWNQANDRIKSLIRNPLRLTLLCLTWKKGGKKLPETKAGLYQRLVEGHYNWKKDKEGFALCTEKQKELNKWLGELAKAALDDEDSRFRLRKNFIESFYTEQKLEDSLRELAIKVGWLLEVGLPTEDEKDADEPVYAFFHPTFQEYFAALAIDDWHFFLNHDNENPNPLLKHNNKDCIYRIFEPQWKEVILLWLGRTEEQIKQQKEKFINNLVDFEDGCGSFYSFYKYRAYFIAASAIAEFSDYTLANQIVRQIINWNAKSIVPFPNRDAAREVMKEIETKRLISSLIEILDNAKDKNQFYYIQAASSLWEIDSSNQIAINALVELLKAGIPFTQRSADILVRIGKGNQIIIKSLEQFIQNPHYKQSRVIAALCLAKINPCNRTALDVLAEIIQSYENKQLYCEAASILAEINPSNQPTIEHLIEMIKKPQKGNIESNQKFKKASFYQRLEEFTNGGSLMPPCDNLSPSLSFLSMLFDWDELKDYPAAINALVKLLETTPSEYLRMQAAERLGEIDKGNQTAIKTIIELIHTKNNEHIRWKARPILEKIGKGNQTAIAALIQMLQTAEDDLTRLSTAYYLGLVDPENSTAINFLVNLVKTTDDIDTFMKGVNSLVKIDPCNETAISFLLEVVKITEDEGTLIDTFNCLWGIKSKKYLPKVVTALKGYLTPQYLENPAPLFEEAYDVIWHCAQNMSYPDFYNAWHSKPSITHPEVPDNIPASNSFIAQNLTLTQKIQIIQSNVASDPTFKDTVQLICIDGSQFSDTNNPATDIYIEMIEQGCPEQQEEPSTMQQLKKYWRLRLKNLEKRVALLFYNSKADREFSETCLTALSTFGGAIAIITDRPCENLQTISPNDPNLIDAVIKWLRRRMLED